MQVSRVISTIIALLLIFLASCKDQKTYADRLKDESRAIDRFIAQNKITVLESFPKDSIFKDNQFYKDKETGVYYQVVDYGNKEEKAKLGDEIYIRYKELHYFMTNDTIFFNNNDPDLSPFPQTLVYRGAVNTSTSSLYGTPGWIVPVPYIGHKGVVRMIIPFVMGSSYDQSQYQPTYYDHVEYRFDRYY